MERWRAWWDRGVGVARRVTERLWAVARDPLRVLPVVAVIALLAIAVPLTVTGLTRVGRERDGLAPPVDDRLAPRDRARVDRAKIDDGLVLDLALPRPARRRAPGRDLRRRRGGKWVGRTVPIRYDAGDPQSVELVGLRQRRPDPDAPARGRAARRRHRRHRARDLAVPPPGARGGERAAAPGDARPAGRGGAVSWSPGSRPGRSARCGSGAGRRWRRRPGTSRPRSSATSSACSCRSWPSSLGCLVTAWLARHRHHDEHDGLLSSAYRMIDKAAGMAPVARGDAPGRTCRPRRRRSADRGAGRDPGRLVTGGRAPA